MMQGQRSSSYPARVSFQFGKANVEMQTGISTVRIVK